MATQETREGATADSGRSHGRGVTDCRWVRKWLAAQRSWSPSPAASFGRLMTGCEPASFSYPDNFFQHQRQLRHLGIMRSA